MGIDAINDIDGNIGKYRDICDNHNQGGSRKRIMDKKRELNIFRQETLCEPSYDRGKVY